MNTHENSSTTVHETPTLTKHAIYDLNGRTYIAISPTHMELLGDASRRMEEAQPGTVLKHSLHSDAWVEQIMVFRAVVLRELRDERAACQGARNVYAELSDRYQALGEALRQEAEERDWCSDYDDFAEEWDLPRRKREFDVTITLRVRALDEDDAEQMVRDQVAISDDDEWVTGGTYFNISEY